MISANQKLAGRTILIGPDSEGHELTTELERHGARVIACPTLEIGEPEDYAALDEAVDNLFGYHWLIFSNANSAEYFLRRFQQLNHEISELDSLRLGAIGEATARKLGESHIHVDLIPERFASAAVFDAIENYVGGRDALRGLNFLIPRANISHDLLPQLLEDSGARADVVPAYRTVTGTLELTQIGALLAGGGIDCLVFTSPDGVEAFAQLFDTNDLPRVLKEIAVACINEATTQAAAELGLHVDVIPAESTVAALTCAVTTHLGIKVH